jgi:hypothetical protein
MISAFLSLHEVRKVVREMIRRYTYSDRTACTSLKGRVCKGRCCSAGMVVAGLMNWSKPMSLIALWTNILSASSMSLVTCLWSCLNTSFCLCFHGLKYGICRCRVRSRLSAVLLRTVSSFGRPACRSAASSGRHHCNCETRRRRLSTDHNVNIFCLPSS